MTEARSAGSALRPGSSARWPLRRRLALALGLAVAVGLLAGSACENVASGVRKVTYPPDFRYVSDVELRSTMGQLGQMTARLDGLARTPEGLAGHREDVLVMLREMERLASRLNPADLPTNHPLLNANLDRLREDIHEARLAAMLEPPRYGRAEAVPGACLICHASTGGS